MADDQPNTLKSRQIAKVVDLISEGPILGVLNGLKGTYLDGVVWQNQDGSMNIRSDVNATFLNGTANQPIVKGFGAQKSEQSVGVQLKYNVPITRAITNLDVDRCSITVSVPALQNVDTKTGDVDGSRVSFNIACQAGTGAFKTITDNIIEGKTTSRYQRAVAFNLPGTGPWNIRVTRTTIDNTHTDIQNDLYWDSYTELIADKINYTLSAVVAMTVDSEQYQTIPNRVYWTYGLIVNIPSNYHPHSGTYTGTWDGTFIKDWTQNPAWVFYDLVVNRRYGLGRWMSAAMVDKWSLYKIAQFCDQQVPNGKGGTEKRFTCNVQITSQQEAFDLLAQIAGIFRGFAYWTGGQLVAHADQPADPIAQYTNANVIDGHFSYSGADIRARHTQVTVAWNDPKNLGEPRIAIVEDQDAISRYGIQALELQAIGCTSEAQAIRTGKWTLYTEEYESETVQFSTGLETAWVRPGDIIRVMDVNVAGKRRGGRVAAGATTTVVPFDAPAGALTPGKGAWISCIIGEGAIETRGIIGWGTGVSATVSEPFSAAPAPDTVFVVNEDDDLEPTLWRVLGSRQTSSDRYEIAALRHFPGKWAVVERDVALTEPSITDIITRWPAVTDLKAVEYMVQTSPISVGVRVTVSWKSGAPSFDVYWRKGNTNVGHQRTDQAAIDVPVTEGTWMFQVIPVSGLGIKGTPASVTFEVIGRFALPSAPKQFRINVVEGIAMFDWLPAPELDVIVGGYFQLRHTATTVGATWASAQVVVPRIPGSATSVETGYQPGTWMLRTFDITGRASTTWAAVVGYQQDTRYFQWQQICENPTWLGTKSNTTIKLPQQWLVIQSVNSGLWDAQTAAINSWGNVDSLPVPPGTVPGPNSGSYKFNQRFDAGDPFWIRFSSDILAFPFGDPDDFIDARYDRCDSWQDWDDVSADYNAQVVILIRSTLDDPALYSAAWTNWKTFIAGEHYGRGFEFQAVLAASPGQNIGVEKLCILGDFKNKIDEGADVAYPAADTRVNFRIKFYNIPSVVITLQEALSTDSITIVNKTREYFTLRVTPQSARTFDWHAQGW